VIGCPAVANPAATVVQTLRAEGMVLYAATVPTLSGSRVFADRFALTLVGIRVGAPLAGCLPVRQTLT
jgi:hypothetical protein